MTKRIYSYGYGGWDEILGVYTVDDWRGVVIKARSVDGSDIRVRTHCTAIATNMLALHVPVGNAYRWAASPDGQCESQEALAALLSRYQVPKHALTRDRLVARLIAG